MSRNYKKVLSYRKPKVWYDLESLAHNYTVALIDEKGRRYLAVGGLTQPTNTSGGQLITLKQLNDMARYNMFIGFNNKNYDDYVVKSIMNGDSAEKVNELSQKIINSHKPAFTFPEKPQSLYGTFDLRAVLPGFNISLKQLASQAGLNVEEYNVDFNIKRPLTTDELNHLIQYNFVDVETTKYVFNHPQILAKFMTHEQMIEHYLTGEDWAMSMTDAKLASRALTDKGSIKVDMKQKFTWELNGHYVLDYIPEQWKNALLEYASNMEDSMVKYNQDIKNGVEPRDAGRENFKEVERPDIDPIFMGNHFRFNPSIGGAHSAYLNDDGEQIVARKRNVHHRDIHEAYGQLALATKLFGNATPNYAGFIDDKHEAKRLHDSSKLAATKLATNAPQGEADNPNSKIYNPIAINENRIMLQILIYQAAKTVIDNGGEVLSVNTDGLFYTGDESKLAPLFEAWNKEWGFDLSYEPVDVYIGKDDNSRLLVENGKITETSGSISHQTFNPLKLGALPRLIDVAVTTKLVNVSTPMEKIVKDLADQNRTDLFAWTLKATKNHKTEINYEIGQRINRVFLTTTGDHIGNYNVTTDKIDAFSGLPDTPVTIVNKKIPDKLPDNINLDAYIEVAKQSYSHWE